MPDVPSWLSEAARDGTSSWVHPVEVEEATVAVAAVTVEETSQGPVATVEVAAVQARRVREANKRLRTIYEDSGVDYGEDVEAEVLVVRFEEAVLIRRRELKEVLVEIGKARNVQLCFLIDATGSMERHIKGTRDAINAIVDRLAGGRVKTVEKFAVSVIAYRDHCDERPGRFEALFFTKDLSKFRIFLDGVEATGGGDPPEDVLGGLDQALNCMNWSDDYGTKLIFHMADAPCHGREFHNLDEDDYPRGDPFGLTPTGIFENMRRQGIAYFFGKITPHTDIMMAKFSEAYGEPIDEFNVKDVKDIKDSVVTSVQRSVGASIGRSMSAGKRRTERLLRVVAGQPSWSSIRESQGVFVTFEMPRSVQSIVDDAPLVRKKPTRGVVKIASNPFAKGAERVAFYGQDLSSQRPEPIVLKEYLHEGANTAQRHEMLNQMQTIAAFMAHEFTKEIRDSTGATVEISFMKIKTLCTGVGSDMRFMSCELLFKQEDKFVRFSNNTDYSLLEENAGKLGVDLDFVRLLMAFSHWTYEVSNKNLMIVDLEGIISKKPGGKANVILTDPAIHCSDITRFGQMNLGSEGMKSFFRRHECNKYCVALGLQTVRI